MERQIAKYLEQQVVLHFGGKAYWAECIEYDDGTAENVLTAYPLAWNYDEGTIISPGRNYGEGTIISPGRLDQITGNTWARDEVMGLFTQWQRKHPNVIGIKRPDYSWPEIYEIFQDDQVQEIHLSTTHWDCECETDYIHPNPELSCPRCQAIQAEQPPSRVEEIH